MTCTPPSTPLSFHIRNQNGSFTWAFLILNVMEFGEKKTNSQGLSDLNSMLWILKNPPTQEIGFEIQICGVIPHQRHLGWNLLSYDRYPKETPLLAQTPTSLFITTWPPASPTFSCHYVLPIPCVESFHQQNMFQLTRKLTSHTLSICLSSLITEMSQIKSCLDEMCLGGCILTASAKILEQPPRV